jgi:Rieske Fe-S protein
MKQDPKNQERRNFFAEGASVVVGGLVSLVPVAAGARVFLDPLRRKSGKGAPAIRVASLDALPPDGVPRKFPVIATRTDAWNKSTAPIGAVYLRRTPEGTVTALNVVCPHAGCFVDFVTEKSCYLCPCHNSTFGKDGAVTDAKSPSARAMDSLEVEVRGGREIWVKFQNFKAGHAEKIPCA